MALKTFNVEEDTYEKFLQFCRERGMSMSKQVDFFMKSVVEEEPKVKASYLEKLERIRKGKFIRVDDFSKRYGD